MNGLSVSNIGFVAATVVGQWIAVALLPLTQGFTRFWPTIVCAACFVFSGWAISRLTHNGSDLGIAIPLIAAIIPLGAIAIGISFYGEPVSLLRVALLLAACGLIGVASFIA